MSSRREVLVAARIFLSQTPMSLNCGSDSVESDFVVVAVQTEGLLGAAMEIQSIFQETGTGEGRMTGSGLGPTPASTGTEAGGLETGSGLGPEAGEESVVGGTFLPLSVVGTLLLWLTPLVKEEVEFMAFLVVVAAPVLAPEMLLLWALLVEFLTSRSYSLMKIPVENIADQM